MPDRGAVARLAGGVRQWNSVWKQFRRWCESGIRDLLLQALADGCGTLEMLQMINSTIIRGLWCKLRFCRKLSWCEGSTRAFEMAYHASE
jgi:hypothetical protein